MSLLQWNEDFRVGVAEVDAQHQRLVALVNELHAAMLQGRGREVLGKTLDELVDYTVTHFGTEERYFEAVRYPFAMMHKAQHDEFVQRVAEFKRGFDAGELMVSLEVMDFLSDWLAGHIKGSDKAFGPFLNERGVA